jgi:hypothetical protein
MTYTNANQEVLSQIIASLESSIRDAAPMTGGEGGGRPEVAVILDDGLDILSGFRTVLDGDLREDERTALHALLVDDLLALLRKVISALAQEEEDDHCERIARAADTATIRRSMVARTWNAPSQGQSVRRVRRRAT